METIEIALAADRGYFCGLLVTACSIAMSCKSAVILSFNILDAGCVVHHAGEIPWKPYRQWVSIFSDAQLLWHRVNARIRGISVWRSVRTWHTFGYVVYHRGLYWLLRAPGIRQFARLILCRVGKFGAWRMIECRTRRMVP